MMEYILAKECKDRLNIISDIHSESRKKELRISDEEEDFLDEGTCTLHIKCNDYFNENNRTYPCFCLHYRNDINFPY